MAEITIPLGNGDSVIVFKDRRALTFNLQDLYKYKLVDSSADIIKTEKGVHIANEGDLVYDFSMGWFRVSRTDYTTYVVELNVWEPLDTGESLEQLDILLGTGPGYASETWRCYLDTRVFPHRLQVDNQLHIRGSEAHEIRIFKGVNVSASGEVISAYYVNNEYVNDAIPLEVYATTKLDNVAEKVPKMGYTSRKLADSEVVTAVTYNIHGMPIDYNKLLIHNTNLTRTPDEAQKRVQGIKLISSRLSSSEPNVLEMPINITVASLAMRAQVTYTDGTTSIMDVVDEDANGKFRLEGLKYWSPTVGGREQELTLTYELSQNEEYSYTQGQTANGRVTEPYLIRGIESDPAYSLKLYSYPTWKDSVNGYILDYWLYDATRQTALRVPRNAVELHPESSPFNGVDFTTIQIMKVAVKMKLIDAAYGDYVHVQQFQVSLLRSGGMQQTNWRMKFSDNQPDWYGDNLMAKVTANTGGLSYIELANGFTKQSDWLNALYYGINPLYDNQSETIAPAPTHVIITTNTRTFELPISQWATKTVFVNDVIEGGVIYLKWIKRMINGDLQLGVSGVVCHNY
ncbi:hypothetical protein D3C85_238930 [compost metagenome]